MAALPPVSLGVSILISFTVVFLVRKFLERVFIDSAPHSIRTLRQFILDISLFFTAGLVTMIYNMQFFGFPAGSGVLQLTGYIALGIFIAIDTGLARERTVILETSGKNMSIDPPRRFYPLTRKFSLVAILTVFLVSLIIVMVIYRDFAWLVTVEKSGANLAEAKRSVVYEIGFIVLVLLSLIVKLIVSYSKNLTLLFDNETGVLKRVSKGDLSGLVPVVTNDEFGFIAGHTNRMILGLRHRSEMLTSLKLAEELQQNLLPEAAPDHPGVDISGETIYCDETGGDYYDYFRFCENSMGILVADAADHGIGSALHMTTARAFMRYGVGNHEKPADLIETVNRHLTRDFGDSGRFITMFFLLIDTHENELSWIRAGHEPALLYDPSTDGFEELTTGGMALGVMEDQSFGESSRQGWASGTIIIIISDGIKEARDPAGADFGRERLMRVIRENREGSATAIRTAVIAKLRKFQRGAPVEDDITLVVAKLD